MGKSVLILGGSYFIGKKISEKLLHAGYKITLLNRGTKQPFSTKIQQISGDRGNKEEINKQ